MKAEYCKRISDKALAKKNVLADREGVKLAKLAGECIYKEIEIAAKEGKGLCCITYNFVTKEYDWVVRNNNKLINEGFRIMFSNKPDIARKYRHNLCIPTPTILIVWGDISHSEMTNYHDMTRDDL